MSVPFSSEETAFIGMGNIDRADDGAGLLIADTLKKYYPNQIFSESERPVDSILMELISFQEINCIILIDATDFKTYPGSYRLFNQTEFSQFRQVLNTHQPPLTLLQQLVEQANKTLYLLGIQPLSIEMMGEVSPIIRACIEHLTQEISRFFSETR
jgi:hydrogenase maturation protease